MNRSAGVPAPLTAPSPIHCATKSVVWETPLTVMANVPARAHRHIMAVPGAADRAMRHRHRLAAERGAEATDQAHPVSDSF